ncbi:hypothetical protein OAE67_00650 [bacterium]|nr:hypothetical protein [bacterium]
MKHILLTTIAAVVLVGAVGWVCLGVLFLSSALTLTVSNNSLCTLCLRG